MKIANTVKITLAVATALILATSLVNVYADPPGGGVPQLLTEILQELEGNAGSATIKGAAQDEGLITDPISGNTYDLVTLTGPGSFVSARMTKQGGGSDLTFLELVIDEEIIIGRSFAALKNWGMTESNPFGVVVLTEGIVDAATIGFQQPIKFEDSLVLRARVNESGVEQIIGTVIYGE